MKQTLKQHGGFFPSDTESAKVLEPGDGAFNGPAFLISAQGSPVLCLGTIAAIGSNHLNAHFSHLIIELDVIIRLVSDQPFRNLPRHHEVKQPLNQVAFVSRSRGAVRRHRKTFGIDHNHDFNTLSSTSAADPISSAFGLRKSSVNKTLVNLEPIALLDQGARFSHKYLEDTSLRPLTKPTVNSALGAKLRRQVLPLCSVVQNPEDSLDNLSLVCRRSSTPGANLGIGNLFA